MKKIAMVCVFVSFVATSAVAFDLGSAVKSVTGGAKDLDCANKALEIVKDGGEKALELFTQVQAGGEISIPSLEDNAGLISNTKSYIENGCAKNHLEKALATINAATVAE